jgi:hypothetical protein
VWKNNHIDSTLNPRWGTAKIPMAILCNGDVDRPLRIDVLGILAYIYSLQFHNLFIAYSRLGEEWQACIYGSSGNLCPAFVDYERWVNKHHRAREAISTWLR